MSTAGEGKPGASVLRPMVYQARHALVVENAVRWWESLRPEGWTEEEHIRMPEAGTVGREQFLLADAVAQLVRSYRREAAHEATWKGVVA